MQRCIESFGAQVGSHDHVLANAPGNGGRERVLGVARAEDHRPVAGVRASEHRQDLIRRIERWTVASSRNESALPDWLLTQVDAGLQFALGLAGA